MSIKYKKLIASILIDVVGIIPIPFFDLIWAPLSSYFMLKMYKGKKAKIASIISFIEEIIPYTDVLPTFTLMWLYVYVFSKEEISEI